MTARARRVLGYLRVCVEAEHAAGEHVIIDAVPGSEPSLLLERGAVPLGGARAELAPSNRARRWAEARTAAAAAVAAGGGGRDGDGDGDGEVLWVGWPVVRGHRRVAGRRVE